MTETTTQETTAPTIGPDPSRAQPPVPAGSSELAVRKGQTGWTEAQEVALRRQVGLEHADDADLMLFFHYATRTGLDPFTRQVYMVGRDTDVKVKERNEDTGNEREVTRRVTKFTIQVGIDGWRVLGNRAAHRDGVRVGHKRPLYAGRDGVWTSVWLDDDNPPVACEYTLVADGVEITSICYYAEYVQTVTRDGKVGPNSMWRKMPRNQLAKCAEALSWRKAFPADFAGLVLEDAAQHDVIDGTIVEDAPAAKSEPRRARGAERNRERAARAQRESKPEPAAEPDPRLETVTEIADILKRGKVEKFDDVAIVVAELGGLDKVPSTAGDISDEAFAVVVEKLRAAEADDKVELDQFLTDTFNAWTARQPEDGDK